jgi:SAM-dependent methyltransferase
VAARNCRLKAESVSVGDAQDLPLKDQCVDVVMILDCLEHVDDDGRVLDECRRVLRKGGRLLITVPAFTFLWTTFDKHSYHKRRYDRRGLLITLREKQFTIHKVSHYLSYLFPVLLLVSTFERLGLRKEDREAGWRNRLKLPPKILNELLTLMGKLEARLLRWVNIPFGSTLVVICENTIQKEE